jgi:transcription elongation factor Elf1
VPIDSRVDEEEFAEDDKDLTAAMAGVRRRFKEFECPDCSASNPVDDGFGNGDEIVCNYCGQELKVLVAEDGKLKLKPT